MDASIIGTINYPMTSLYVGDLHTEVTEAILFEKFSQTGPVLSIRVCRDVNTRRSLGYAYVNFQHTEDAERALDTMNFDVIRGKPMRIMWSQRDPSLRRSGVGNIFIKNLDKSIDNKDMYDTFSTFGTILSCKVAIDEEGGSKGYGFVHFETEEAAKKAIEKVNGMLLSDKKLFVGHFIPRKERERIYGGKPKFCNLYVKNIPLSYDDEKLKQLFQPYGTTTSVCIVLDDNGRSRGFGFVCFSLPEAAETACDEMNGKELEEKILYVGRAQRKSERQLELKRRFEQIKMERISKSLGVNLYVKNLDDSIQDEQLRSQFQHFGLITSAKVMTTDDGKSKCFGFVCFTTPEEAAKAVTEMSGKPMIEGGKPLYVALAQRRDDRKVLLTQQYMQRIVNLDTNVRMPQIGQMYSAGNYMIPTIPPQPRFYHSPQMPNVMHSPRWMQPQPQMRQAGQPPPAGFPMMQAHYRTPNRSGGGPIGPPVPSRSYSRQIQGRGQQNGHFQQHVPFQHQIQRALNNVHVHNVNQSPVAATNDSLGVSNGNIPGALGQKFNTSQTFHPNATVIEPPELSTAALIAAQPNDQKQMLGERLFPLVQEKHPVLAGKITGMLLEMDNTEILHMIEDREVLSSRMEEAKNTLDIHNTKPANH